MQFNLHWRLVSALLFLALGALAPVTATEPHKGQEADSTAEVIADLEQFVPDYMVRQRIPGAAIALIHEGRVSWVKGFGVTNVVTDEPITADTLFHIASNSKVITAYTALRLVDDGQLSLDQPLNSYLPEPWLPQSDYRDTITLRQVLSHSSGLGHNMLGRDNLFAPGLGFSYSSVGFQYLQTVIEQVTGRPLEDVAQELVFKPLAMTSSSFVHQPDLDVPAANGHLSTPFVVTLCLITYVIALLVIVVIGLPILRIRTGRWRPMRPAMIFAIGAALPLSLLPAFILLGAAGLWEFAWLLSWIGFALLVTGAVVFMLARSIIPAMPRSPGLRSVLITALSMVMVTGLAVLVSNSPPVPVPNGNNTQAQAAGSMQSTAKDMAAFLIELSDPQLLSPELTAQMQKAQIALNAELSWGLGPGILHSPQGDALWQWGQHLHFQSIMVSYPAHKTGIVVLTNNDLFNPDVAMEMADRALRGELEPMRRAIHLELNYRD